KRPVEPEDLPAESEARPEVDPKTIRRVRRGRRNLADFDHLPVRRNVHNPKGPGVDIIRYIMTFFLRLFCRVALPPVLFAGNWKPQINSY
ncbi:MAG TPA: hypothetical protein VGG19_16975, partial [Tepidisphaeraceae bacterium]